MCWGGSRGIRCADRWCSEAPVGRVSGAGVIAGAMGQGPLRGLVRTPDESLAWGCLLTHMERAPIDFDLALHQHADYVTALEECGVEVEILPPLEGHPDATFVEDAALVFDELSVLTRSGAEVRRGEVESIRPHLPTDRSITRITEPASLDGGDVLCVGRNVLVGTDGDAGAVRIPRAGD